MNKKGRRKLKLNFLTFFPRRKKGMGIGQVFIFIVAALTFALIMIFGYQAITDFLDKGEDVQFVQFKTELEKSVKKIYTEYGAVRVQQFSMPVGYEQVCFVDLDYNEKNLHLDGLCKKDQAACLIWEDSSGYEGADENVFLKPPAPVKIKIHKIKIASDQTTKGFLCVPVKNGAFRLVLEGKGDRTELSLPDEQ